MKELTLQAKPEAWETVLGFIEENLEEWGCPMKEQMSIQIAAEEIYINIARYAYAPNVGDVSVVLESISRNEGIEGARIIFKDGGRPYNPLDRDNPDITLSAEERQIGGLGIFMTKKLMDDLEYRYEQGKNTLTLVKRWQR